MHTLPNMKPHRKWKVKLPTSVRPNPASHRYTASTDHCKAGVTLTLLVGGSAPPAPPLSAVVPGLCGLHEAQCCQGALAASDGVVADGKWDLLHWSQPSNNACFLLKKKKKAMKFNSWLFPGRYKHRNTYKGERKRYSGWGHSK